MIEYDYIPAHYEAFIQQNIHRDLAELALDAKKHEGLPMPFIIDQIYGRRKAKDKLPTWFTTPDIIYPPKVSVEQCSSELTAEFKASLIEGKSLLDITGGFGVDDTFFSRKFDHVTYTELQGELAKIVEYNAMKMGIKNLHVYNKDGLQELNSITTKKDWIYLDPARRGDRNQKVFSFVLSQPNILKIKDLLLQKANKTLVKLSPMLDIKLGINELNCVEKVWVVAVQNECKEILFQLGSSTQQSSINVACVNILKDGTRVNFEATYGQELHAEVKLSLPQAYIYEPNVAILKGGLYKSLASQFQLDKLHAHSHLYTSQELNINFPGRIFKCLKVLKFNKKELWKALPDRKANITVRNFPLTVAEIRKKTAIKDGGNQYLFATTDVKGNKVCLLCEKV